MSGTLLLTGYDERFAPLGELTIDLLHGYALRHDFDFFCQRHYPDCIPAYWQKIPDTIAGLKSGYDRVFWVDADQMITNPKIGFHGFQSGLSLSQDWGEDATEPGHFSACAYIACRDSLPIFEWIEAHRAKYQDGDFPEQTPMRELYQRPEFQPMFRIMPRRVFNAVPIEVHPTVVNPWEPCDWAAHLTMLSIPDRVTLFYHILSKL